MVLGDEKRALLGDRKAAKRLTEAGVLLPCRTCGSAPRLRNDGIKIDHGNRFLEKECDFFTSWYVACRCGETKCGWVTQYHLNDDGTVTMIGKRDGRKEAIQNWNTRSPLLTPEQLAALERMEGSEIGEHSTNQV